MFDASVCWERRLRTDETLANTATHSLEDVADCEAVSCKKKSLWYKSWVYFPNNWSPSRSVVEVEHVFTCFLSCAFFWILVSRQGIICYPVTILTWATYTTVRLFEWLHGLQWVSSVWAFDLPNEILSRSALHCRNSQNMFTIEGLPPSAAQCRSPRKTWPQPSQNSHTQRFPKKIKNYPSLGPYTMAMCVQPAPFCESPMSVSYVWNHSHLARLALASCIAAWPCRFNGVLLWPAFAKKTMFSLKYLEQAQVLKALGQFLESICSLFAVCFG